MTSQLTKIIVKSCIMPLPFYRDDGFWDSPDEIGQLPSGVPQDSVWVLSFIFSSRIFLFIPIPSFANIF